MKILFTTDHNGPNALETFEYYDDTAKLVLWHQDNLNNELLEKIISLYGRPDIIVNSAHPTYPTDTEYYFWPDDLTNISLDLQQLTNLTDYSPEHCFNFIINKARPNRVELINQLNTLGLTNCDYTLNFDSNTQFNKKFISGIATKHSDMYGRNLHTIFSKSVISLITEPSNQNFTVNFTEKSLFSVIGLTFPIWIDGYKAPSLWESYGFDIFSDVINHNYQYCTTMEERISQAITDNMRILSDLEFGKELKQKHHNRLVANRMNMHNNVVSLYVNCFDKIPVVLQQAFADIINGWNIDGHPRRLLNKLLPKFTK